MLIRINFLQHGLPVSSFILKKSYTPMQFRTEPSCYFAAKPILHNHFSIMHFHAQIMQKIVLEKSGYAKLSTEVQPR